MAPKLLSSILGYWLIANLLFVSAWDIIVVALGLPNATVSYRLYEEMQERPWLYFVVGLALGHLAVPLTVHVRNGG